MRVRIEIFIPDEHFDYVVVLELTPKLDLINDLVLQSPDAQPRPRITKIGRLRIIHCLVELRCLKHLHSVWNRLICILVVPCSLNDLAECSTTNRISKSQESIKLLPAVVQALYLDALICQAMH